MQLGRVLATRIFAGGRAWCQPIGVRHKQTTARKDTRLRRFCGRLYKLLWAAGCASLVGCDRRADPAPESYSLPVAASSGATAAALDPLQAAPTAQQAAPPT